MFLELKTMNYIFCLKLHILYTKHENVMIPKHLTKLGEKQATF